MGNKHGHQTAAPTKARGPAQQPKAQPNPILNTAQDIRATINRLEKRRDFLNKKIEAETAQARTKAKANNKKEALIHLKKKKLYEKNVSKLDGQIFNLEQQVITVESGSVNVDVINAMKQGANAQKMINEQINVDKAADLVEQIQELQQDAEEVSDLLAQPMGDALDDDELLNELDELGTEELEKELETSLPAVPTQGVSVLPSVPTQGVATAARSKTALPEAPKHNPQTSQANADDEAALRELMAEMG